MPGTPGCDPKLKKQKRFLMLCSLIYSFALMRTPEEVIDQAIEENRVPEYILYGMAIAFLFLGIMLIIWSIMHGQPWTAVAGAALDGLAWPAYKQTKILRQQNLILRMLEIPLSRAKTAEEAAKMLTEKFDKLFKPEENNQAKKKGAIK